MIAENEQSNERFVEECLAEMAVSEMHAIEANKVFVLLTCIFSL